MKKSFPFLFLILLTCSIFGQLPRLHLDGQNIYDHNDSLVMLRGFNWGWWGEALPEDAGIIKNELGGNAVRLAFRWHYWGGSGVDNPMNARDSLSPGNIKPAYLAQLDQYIEWLSSEELWTVLFINSDQGAGKNENHFLNTPYLKEEFIETWKFLANRYKESPYLAAFELMAEPQFQKHNRDVGPGDIVGLYKEIADSINTITAHQIPFVIGPQNYYLPDSLSEKYYMEGYQIIYAANMFKPGDFCRGTASYAYPSDKVNKESIENYYNVPIQFREKFNVPVWVDQWGASRLSEGYVKYTEDVIDFLERNKLHWTYWNWRQYSGDRGIYERYPKWSGEYQLDTMLFILFDSVLTGEECQATSSFLSDTACGSYTSPGGKIWTLSGSYLDTIQNAEGCDSIISIKLLIECPAAFMNTNALPWTAYPNPVKDVLHIDLDKQYENLLLEVYDSSGKLHSSKHYDNIDLITFSFVSNPGIYMVRLSNRKGETSVFNIIKH